MYSSGKLNSKACRAKHTCKCRAKCAGMRSLHDVLAHDSYRPIDRQQHHCAQAIEAELLLHGIHYGFYVLKPHQAVTDVPPLEVDNYAHDPIDVNALHAKIRGC